MIGWRGCECSLCSRLAITRCGSACAKWFCCLQRLAHRLNLPAVPMTMFRCLALIVPVMTCCEVLCDQARTATDTVHAQLQQLCTTNGPCTVSSATFESIAQLNADLISTRQSLQPLLVTGVAFCLMWGSLVGIVWLGGTAPAGFEV